MDKTTFYFFVETPWDYAICFGLANVIKSSGVKVRLELICSNQERVSNYDFSNLTGVYDKIHHVRSASFGKWKKGLTLRNIISALSKYFPVALRSYQDLQYINFSDDTFVFINGGGSLNKVMLLRRIKREKKFKSVLLTDVNVVSDKTLHSDWYLNRSQSAILNMYVLFFGTAFLDVYWIKTPKSIKTNHRQLNFREKPSDYVFRTVYPLRYKKLQPGEIYLPLIAKNEANRENSKGTVLFVGGKYHFLQGLPKKSEAMFFERLNKIITLITKKHSGLRLLYKSHPSQNQDDLDKVDLAGFEIESLISSEDLFLNDSSLQTVYSVNSTSVQSAASMGIQSFYLYNLFDLDELSLPRTIQRHWNDRCDSEVYPEMNIRSIEDWMNGKNDYVPLDMREKLNNSILSMLEEVGVLDFIPEIKMAN